MSKRMFLAWTNVYGIQGMEGDGYRPPEEICIVEGNNLEELVDDYCKKTGISRSLYTLEKNNGKSYYASYGFPVRFLEIHTDFDPDNGDDFNKIVYPEEATINPFE